LIFRRVVENEGGEGGLQSRRPPEFKSPELGSNLSEYARTPPPFRIILRRKRKTPVTPRLTAANRICWFIDFLSIYRAKRKA